MHINRVTRFRKIATKHFFDKIQFALVFSLQLFSPESKKRIHFTNKKEITTLIVIKFNLLIL